MEGEFQVRKDGIFSKRCSKLLELSATDDVTGFIHEVEGKGCKVNELSIWYGKRIGLKKMGFEERTPLLIAATYGSLKVLNYIIETGNLNVNDAYGFDGVTALHCAAAGGSELAVEAVKLLIDAGADINSIDANGNKPGDLITPCFKALSYSRRKTLEMLLKGTKKCDNFDQEKEQGETKSYSPKVGMEKKDYPLDVSLPDINNGIYVTDEFRMYNFKINPCSRAYSHDWTECPFVHPGENARRRDPRKYQYTCVPCLDFKRGTCSKGDSCEYAHGVFESWLHPAQYRTRLCKDETGCSRKVCFFAHRPEELRPLYAATGSAMPSPASGSMSSMDLGSLGPSALGSTSLSLPTCSIPPRSPSIVCSSSIATNTWQNKLNPPTMQLPGSRLRTSFNSRDVDLETELLGSDSILTHQQQRQQMIDEMACLSSTSAWSTDYNKTGDLKPTNLDNIFGSYFQCLSPKYTASPTSQMHSPSSLQMRQNMNPLCASYPSNVSSSGRHNSSAAVAAALMNSRSSSLTKRSQSFIDRGGMSHLSGSTGAARSPVSMSANMSDWGSPDGKLDWGCNRDELSKLRKSASFVLRIENAAAKITTGSFVPEKRSGSILEKMPSWTDQLYIEQQQMVA